MGKLKKNIIEFWNKNYEEIIDSIVKNQQNDKRNKSELEEQRRRKRQVMTIFFIVGCVYILIGSALLVYLKNSNEFSTNPQTVVVCCELIVLGIYALLYVFIFGCENGRRREYSYVKIIKKILILLILPYHLCMKGISALIKISRQEHVINLLPYYMISLLMVMCPFILIVRYGCIYQIFDTYWAPAWGLAIVALLIVLFFSFGKGLAWLVTKWVIWSVQKAEVKKISTKNIKETLKNKEHKAMRREKLKTEWKLIKKELEYTKIYFYILLTFLVLIIPKQDGTVTAMLVNQFLGIMTITALGREVRSKYDCIENVAGGK